MGTKMHTGPLRGHGLFYEGAAFDDRGHRVRSQGTGGTGHGLCQCGAKSDTLTSGGQRRDWHRQHKTDIVEGTSR